MPDGAARQDDSRPLSPEEQAIAHRALRDLLVRGFLCRIDAILLWRFRHPRPPMEGSRQFVELQQYMESLVDILASTLNGHFAKERWRARWDDLRADCAAACRAMAALDHPWDTAPADLSPVLDELQAAYERVRTIGESLASEAGFEFTTSLPEVSMRLIDWMRKSVSRSGESDMPRAVSHE